MKWNRRRWLQQTAMAAAGTWAGKSWALAGAAGPDSTALQHEAHAASSTMAAGMAPTMQAPPPRMLHSLELTPFVDSLPLPKRLQPRHGPLRLEMREGTVKVHRDVPPTRVWSYAPPGEDVAAVAPMLEARSGQPLAVEWVHDLPVKHFLPVDHSLHGCGRDVPEVRAVAHLHGACVPSSADGYPEDWITRGQKRLCTYPMRQDAALLWYHDHAMGLNRLNTYAGLFGLLAIRDRDEEAQGLPSGEHELPLMLYDRDLTADGQLFYPRSADPEHPWVPEFAGDALLVNGRIRPFVEVEPRPYRLRILNASNSRFFVLSLSTREPMLMIGSDQGLLASATSVKQLVLAPAERADLIVDFRGAAGGRVHLLQGALEALEFRVASRASTPVRERALPARLRTIEPLRESDATVVRSITLNEYQDDIARPMVMLLNRKHWHEPVTERVRLGATEVWEFINLTEDTHPMHLHMVRFQVLDRRPFEAFDYLKDKQLHWLGPAEKPPAIEQGWKDVVQCPPAMVTRIVARFDGYPGRYLYHCHVLEHEANDMMRPFEVIA